MEEDKVATNPNYGRMLSPAKEKKKTNVARSKLMLQRNRRRNAVHAPRRASIANFAEHLRKQLQRAATLNDLQGRPAIADEVGKKNNFQKHMNKTIAYKFYRFLEDPSFSNISMLFMIVIVACILASVLVLIAVSVEDVDGRREMEIVLQVINVVFLVELVMRITSHLLIKKNPTWNLYLWIDFLSLIPFFLELAIDLETVPKAVHALNSLRILRLIKLGRYYSGFGIFSTAIRMSVEALMIPVGFLLVFGLFCAVLLFHIEDGVSDRCGYTTNVFPHIPDAIWFVTVTMTTVGYGDIVPCTGIGKVISALVMLGGVIFMAMPIAVIGTNFTETWAVKEKTLLLLKMKDIVKNRLELKYDMLEALIREMDTDNDKKLDFEEFRAFVKLMGMTITREQTKTLFEVFDVHNGQIDSNRLLAVLFVHEHERRTKKKHYASGRNIAFDTKIDQDLNLGLQDTFKANTRTSMEDNTYRSHENNNCRSRIRKLERMQEKTLELLQEMSKEIKRIQGGGTGSEVGDTATESMPTDEEEKQAGKESHEEMGSIKKVTLSIGKCKSTGMNLDNLSDSTNVDNAL